MVLPVPMGARDYHIKRGYSRLSFSSFWSCETLEDCSPVLGTKLLEHTVVSPLNGTTVLKVCLATRTGKGQLISREKLNLIALSPPRTGVILSSHPKYASQGIQVRPHYPNPGDQLSNFC